MAALGELPLCGAEGVAAAISLEDAGPDMTPSLPQSVQVKRAREVKSRSSCDGACDKRSLFLHLAPRLARKLPLSAPSVHSCTTPRWPLTWFGDERR